jgi:hypothetical protein
MLMSSRRRFGAHRGSRRAPALMLESLEGRIVLAPTMYTVNTTADIATGTGTSGSLRYVLGLANADPNPDGSTIGFDPTVFATPQTITLSSGLGQLNLGETAGPQVIQGPTGGVTVSGGGAVQVFNVAAGVTATISGLTISGGSTSVFTSGGGVSNSGTLSLTDCTVADNSTGALGAGLYNNGTLSLTDCSVADNSAQGFGGGLYNARTLSLTDCTLADNSAGVRGGGLGAGGGLENTGTLSLTACTVSGNSAYRGGGLYSTGTQTMTLTACTIADNTASNSAGGVYNAFGKVILTASTVADNTAGSSAGGLENASSGTATLANTIVADNAATGPSDIAGSAAAGVTGSFNLIGTGGSGGITGGAHGNIVLTSLTDLGLAPLGDYGGPTQTMALLPGSAAIGQGTAVTGLTTDQRGEPLASPPDLGAFQSQGFTMTAVPGSTPQSAGINTSFSNPLAVAVTANNPVEPVAGGLVTFAATPRASGASATLSAPTATIGSDGQASVTATANAIAGSYTVTASAAGVASPASFSLTNNAGAPTSIVVVTGSPQSATVAQSFASPLVVVVEDAEGNPVAGVSVTFAAPASGPSAALSSLTATTGSNGQASVMATANAIAGSYTVTTSIAGVASPASFSLTNEATLTQLAPVVEGLQRFGYHDQPTAFVLTFSTALAPTSAEDVANYRLNPISGHHLGPTIPIKAAVYDPATDTVTLHPAHRVYLFRQYRLMVNGSTPTGVAGTTGLLLDGKENGQPGSDFVTTFGKEILAGPIGVARVGRNSVGISNLTGRKIKVTIVLKLTDSPLSKTETIPARSPVVPFDFKTEKIAFMTMDVSLAAGEKPPPSAFSGVMLARPDDGYYGAVFKISILGQSFNVKGPFEP